MAVLALAACAPTQWTRPGADTAAVTDDLAECSRIARSFAARAHLLSGRHDPLLYPYRDPRYRAFLWQDRMFDRQMTESQLQQTCMREKGYSLMPVAPSAQL